MRHVVVVVVVFVYGVSSFSFEEWRRDVVSFLHTLFRFLKEKNKM